MARSGPGTRSKRRLFASSRDAPTTLRESLRFVPCVFSTRYSRRDGKFTNIQPRDPTVTPFLTHVSVLPLGHTSLARARMHARTRNLPIYERKIERKTDQFRSVDCDYQCRHLDPFAAQCKYVLWLPPNHVTCLRRRKLLMPHEGARV